MSQLPSKFDANRYLFLKNENLILNKKGNSLVQKDFALYLELSRYQTILLNHIFYETKPYCENLVSNYMNQNYNVLFFCSEISDLYRDTYLRLTRLEANSELLIEMEDLINRNGEDARKFQSVIMGIVMDCKNFQDSLYKYGKSENSITSVLLEDCLKEKLKNYSFE